MSDAEQRAERAAREINVCITEGMRSETKKTIAELQADVADADNELEYARLELESARRKLSALQEVRQIAVNKLNAALMEAR